VDDRLTRCEQPGTCVSFSNPSPQERDTILLHYTALRGAKHGVVADEVSHGDGSFELKIHHYKSCTRCLIDSGKRVL
jgi:hypothetical protein